MIDIVVLDCFELLATLPDQTVDLIVTDPAYSGMNKHLKLGRGRIVGDYAAAGTDDGRWFTEFHDDPENFVRLLTEFHRVLRMDRHLYMMFDSYSLLTLAPLVRDVFDVKNIIVWDKVNIGMGHYYRRQHELIVMASKGKRKIENRSLSDVWRVPRIARAKLPTQKPVELFARMIEASAYPGEVVVDPFVGSGSSAIAALRRGCHFFGSDVSQHSVDIARARCESVVDGLGDPLE